MAYRKVTEEEFKRWAAQNPGAVVRIDGQETQVPAPQAQDLGFFGNLARGVTKPIRAVAAMPEYLVQALGAANKGETGIKQGEFKSIFLTPEEERAWAKDPVKQGVKSSFALGSGLIPGGGGAAQSALGRVGTAAGRGAVAGTMSGFGYSEEGQEAQGALGGGALGGILGGALQGAGELAQGIRGGRLSELGADIEKKGVGISREGIPTGESAADDLFSSAKRITGGDLSPGGMDKAYKGLSKSIDRSLKASSITANTDDLVLDAARRLVDEVGVSEDVALRLVGSALEKAGTKGTLNAQGLATLKKATQPNALKVQRAFEMGGSPSRAIYADYALNDIADQVLKSGIDDVGREAYQSMSTLYRVAPDIIKKADKAGHITVANVRFPTGNIPQKAQVGLGKLLSGAGESLSSGKVGNAVSQLAGVGQSAVPGIVGAGQAMPQAQRAQPEGISGMPPQQQGPQLDQMALIEAVLNGQISKSEAEWLMEMLGGTQGQAMPKTDSGRKAMVARDAALQALNILEQDPKAAGKLQGIENLFYDITGQANTATEYKTQIEGLRSQVFNALGGTALSPTEKAQYEKFLPKQNDSPAQAKQKLQILIPMMEALMGTEVDMPSEDNSSALYQMLGLQ